MHSAEDQLAIAAVLARYCHLIDTGQADRLADEVFAQDARIDYSLEPRIGAKAISDFFVSATGNRKYTTAHFVSTYAIEGDGDTATSTCYYQAWRWAPETAIFGPLRPADSVSIGAYDDAWTRTPKGWRISRRTLRMLGAGPVGMGRAPHELAVMFEERARKAAEAG
jgi:hypothetical protein